MSDDDEFVIDSPGSDLDSDAGFSDAGTDLDEYAALMLACTGCSQLLSVRGTSVHLLADDAKRLFSSDAVLPSVRCVTASEREIATCACRIQTMRCVLCTHPVGYHVTAPCAECLSGDNNGHTFMFSSPHIAVVQTRAYDDPMAGVAVAKYTNGNVNGNSNDPDMPDLAALEECGFVMYFLGEGHAVSLDTFHQAVEERQVQLIAAVEGRRGKARAAMVTLKSWAAMCEVSLGGGGGGDGSDGSGGGGDSGGSGASDGEHPDRAERKALEENGLSEAALARILIDLGAAPSCDGGRQEVIRLCRILRRSSRVTWTRNIAQALGKTLKAFQCVTSSGVISGGVVNSSGSGARLGEDDVDAEAQGEGETDGLLEAGHGDLFWLNDDL